MKKIIIIIAAILFMGTALFAQNVRSSTVIEIEEWFDVNGVVIGQIMTPNDIRSAFGYGTTLK